MLRFVVLGLAATLACASPLHDLSIGGALLQGNFAVGAQSGLFSAASVESLVAKHLKSVEDEATLEKLFAEFKQLFGKQYKSGAHESISKQRFLQRLQMTLENNLKALHGESSYVLGLHHGSDMTVEESLAVSPAGMWPSATVPQLFNETSYVASWTIDLRTQHQVTDVVSQGSCGACVYFAAAACIESFWARKGHGLVHLSPQQLNDCARNDARGNHDCNHGGGTFVPTFDYIKAHGMTSWQNYPYLAKGDNCKHDKEAQAVAKIASWHPVLPHTDEMALETSVRAHGAHAVAFHVNDAVQGYRHGIFDAPCQGGRNHAVTVIGLGFDEASSKDFWIIKNQWTNKWGEGGFMRMRRKHGNLCDVAGDAVYVL